MPYVVTTACIDVKDGACQVSCPVDCIYEGGAMMYIHPEECINCGLCVSVCPVKAIFAEIDLPDDLKPFEEVNAAFFSDSVTGWGSPGGVTLVPKSAADHPYVLNLRDRLS
ncbi:ferredoxin [Aminobacter lissarensis]|uniref:Ferredoxin n=1 Tax=Aminobacter carboxidus TaxID=376165 RepID=A0A8E1WL93_9HYPH|nr:ferredoxin [Aminobacter lissarensis]MBB6470054.1 ferredoxin [Aminobacter lissarensis]